MFAIRLDNNEPALEQAVAAYDTLVFSEVPDESVASFERRDETQHVVMMLNAKEDTTKVSEYGWDAKCAWRCHADAVLVPLQTEFESYFSIASAIRGETYNSIAVWLAMPPNLVTTEHLRILDTMQVRAVVLYGKDAVMHACETKRKYHLSLRIVAHASEHAHAAEVHSLRQAGAEHILLSCAAEDHGSFDACERVRETYTLTFGSGRKTLRKLLLESVGIVQRVPETHEPFITKSGMKTRTYVDVRRLVSYPKYLAQIAKGLLGLVPPHAFDIVAGIPTGAVPLAAVMSHVSGKPLIMLRDKPKTYGMRKQVEGVFQYNRRCLLVEDVTTTGMSILNMLHVVRKAGLVIDQAVVVVARDQKKPYALLEKAQCTLHALFSLNDAMQLE